MSNDNLKEKLTNITMKAIIHTKFISLSSSACPKWLFESKKQELRHFKIASKVQMYSQRRRPTRTSWKQKLTNLTMKAIIHTNFFPLSSSACPKRGFESKKQELRNLKLHQKFKCTLKEGVLQVQVESQNWLTLRWKQWFTPSSFPYRVQHV